MSRPGFAAVMVLQAASITLAVGAGLLASGVTTIGPSNPGVHSVYRRPATVAEAAQHRAEMERLAQDAVLREFMAKHPTGVQ